MNDAPPVTSAVFPAQNDSVVATPRLPPDSLARPDVFENFQIFLKLGHSIIGGCGGPCRRFHRLQLPPVRHQVPDHADEFPVVVRIGSYRKALLHAKRPNVAFPGSYGNNRFSGRQNSVHFAWDHHSFQPTLYGDYVRVGGGQNRGDLCGGGINKKTDGVGPRPPPLDPPPLGGLAPKNKSDPLS